MVCKNTESTSSNGMTEELLTSSFGSHESVCKPDQPDLGQGETRKIEQFRRNIYKVGSGNYIYLILHYNTLTIQPLIAWLNTVLYSHYIQLLRSCLNTALYYQYTGTQGLTEYCTMISLYSHPRLDTGLDTTLYSHKLLIKFVFQLLGAFSLRENVFYGVIFLSMTLIVLFCFLIVNRNNNTSSFYPSHQAIYDMGKFKTKLANRSQIHTL